MTVSVYRADVDERSDRPRADVLEEGERLVRAAAERGLTVRLLGGAAVAHLCPSARRAPLARPYKDVDLAGLRRERSELAALLGELGYDGRDEFNVLQGGRRLLFHDSANDRQLDVVLDRFEMCHALELSDRLALGEIALGTTDLLLTKLQVRATNERDLKDAAAILLDCDVDVKRVAQLLASDWGWWRTATEVLDRVEAYVLVLAEDERTRVQTRIEALRTAIGREPRSARWRVRALVGDRVRWYQEPEEDY